MENEIIHLSKDLLLPVLQTRVDELDCAIKSLVKKAKSAPSGMLGISPHHGKYQFFHVTAETGAKGKFITKENLSLAKSLAQRDYEKKSLVLLGKQSKLLNHCLEKYSEFEVEQLWDSLHPARREMVEPLTLTDDEFLKRWRAVEYKPKGFDADASVLLSVGGDRVRSKSEVIIADTLQRFDVPYRYEFPYVLKQGCRRLTVHPDFTCLNKRTRQEFIWEHFGLVDDTNYAENMVKKVDMYQENGFAMGKNFLMTMETREKPLSSKNVARLVQDFLL